MVVHHAHGLHKRVADGRSHKIEASSLQRSTQSIRLRSPRRDLMLPLPRIQSRPAVHKLPHVAVETAEFFPHPQQGLGIPHRRRDLQPVAYDAGIAQQLCDLPPVVARYASHIELVKRGAIVFPFVENRLPAQPGLRPFEDEKLKKRAVIVHRHAPFFIVIANHQLAARPITAHLRLRRRLRLHGSWVTQRFGAAVTALLLKYGFSPEVTVWRPKTILPAVSQTLAHWFSALLERLRI